MMQDELSENDEAMIYAEEEPAVEALQAAYKDCLGNLEDYFQSCLRSYNDRRNRWSGKSVDLRKHGANAFPWEGASDMEVNVIGERIDSYVALLDQALERSHIKAFPSSHDSVARASVVSAFLKWMRKTYIPQFKHHMELGANYLLEKSIMVTYVGWKKEKRTFKQMVTLEQLVAEMPDLVEMILDESSEPDAAAYISKAFPEMPPKLARLKCISHGKP